MKSLIGLAVASAVAAATATTIVMVLAADWIFGAAAYLAGARRLGRGERRWR